MKTKRYLPAVAFFALLAAAGLLKTLPNTGSSVLIRLQNDVEAAITGCRGEWVKVNYRGVEGWLAPGSYCGASITTCS